MSESNKSDHTPGCCPVHDAGPETLKSLQELVSLVCVMFGKGPDAVIPTTVSTPIGVPVKIGDIVRDAETAIAHAERQTTFNYEPETGVPVEEIVCRMISFAADEKKKSGWKMNVETKLNGIGISVSYNTDPGDTIKDYWHKANRLGLWSK